MTIFEIISIVIFIILPKFFRIWYYFFPKKEYDNLDEKTTEPPPKIFINRRYFGSKRYIKVPPIYKQYKHKDLI